jgi:hypothetical protein
MNKKPVGVTPEEYDTQLAEASLEMLERIYQILTIIERKMYRF